MTCSACGSPEVFALGRCRSDYRFHRRHKRDRTPQERLKRNQRRLDQRLEREAIRGILGV